MDTTFIEELASSAPVPGGGGASAYVGAIAASLASMVGELTVGKASYADVQEEVIGALGRLAVLRARFIELIEEDAEAFSPLAQAYRMPKDTPEAAARKNEAMQAALVGATSVPLEIMHACLDVMQECKAMAFKGSRMAVSDAGACMELANAAMHAASLNVLVNLKSMDDASMAAGFLGDIDAIIEEATPLYEEVKGHVLAQLGRE